MSGTGLPEILERVERLSTDQELGVVRSWKQRTGGLAVGHLPIYVPREIFHALGVLPVGLVGGGEIEIIRGDAYYQSYICHIPRSTLELGLSGRLDVLDGMIFPAICDVIRNLSGMWQLQFPDKLVRYLDVPQNFQEERGGRFYRAELESLARDLSERGARPLQMDTLRASLHAYNENRRRVREVYDLRRREPWRVPTSELYQVMRAGLVLPVEAFTALLVEYLNAVRRARERKPMDQARVILTGCFCEPPPLGLLRTLERSGCYIVDDDLLQIHRWIRHDIPLGGDPLDNLVQAFLKDSMESPTRYIGEMAKGGDLERRVRESGAEGVLFSAPSFCDPALLDQPMTTRAMEAASVPWTSFKYSENTGQFQVIREQAGTFADSIKLWSEA